MTKKESKPKIEIAYKNTFDPVYFTPSGLLSLDVAIGGGFPQGRIVQLTGEPTTGKTTMALFMSALMGREGKRVIYYDAESVDQKFARAIGLLDGTVEIADVPGEGMVLENVYNDISKLVLSDKAPDLIVLDSYDAIPSQAEYAAEVGDKQMAERARLTSDWLRSLAPKMKATKTCLVIICQMRANIGVMYGNPNHPTGGKAIKFFASIIIEMMAQEKLWTDGKAQTGLLGTVHHGKIKKNKVGTPYKDFYWKMSQPEVYIDILWDRMDMALQTKVLDKRGGGYFYLEGEQIAHGEPAMLELLKTDTELFLKLEQKVRAKLAE